MTLALALGDRRRRFAQQTTDLAFERPDTRFAGVTAHYLAQRGVRDLHFAVEQTGQRQLAADEVLARDGDLLLIGVAVELHHFHAVEQRPRNLLREVGRGQEQDVGQ